MTEGQWESFLEYRENVKSLCKIWAQLQEELYPLQKQASQKDTPPYPLETAVVYNQAYDLFTKNDDIKLIVIGDNPGKEEQLKKNRKYLVGQSGRLADGFFKKNPELNIDFKKNVIIINKTPVHTAKTSHLKYLLKNGSKQVQDLIIQSQIKMAECAFTLHKNLIATCQKDSKLPQLWLVGYAELKGKGLFLSYKDTLKKLYSLCDVNCAWQNVFVYQHFSMNRFSIDLKEYRKNYQELSLTEALEALGTKHKQEIFGN